jgi:hypothetical protein
MRGADADPVFGVRSRRGNDYAEEEQTPANAVGLVNRQEVVA